MELLQWKKGLSDWSYFDEIEDTDAVYTTPHFLRNL